MGWFGGSDTKVSNTTNNTNIDRRQAVGEGATSVGGDGSTLTINTLDANAINKALAFATDALGIPTQSLGFVGDVVDRAFASVGASTEFAKNSLAQMLDANQAVIASVQAEKSGSLDNKTIVILTGVIAVAGILILRGRK